MDGLTDLSNLRIVVMESPYDSWGDPTLENLFRDLIGVKIRGYRKEYPYGVLPVDGADFISTHFSICIEEPHGLRPVMGIRWTSHRKCRLHYMNFPGLSLVQQAGEMKHVRAVEELIRSADDRRCDLYYSGAFAIDPLARRNKSQSILYRELLTMMYVRGLDSLGPAETMAGGTLRFKIDDYIREMGHHPLRIEDNDLGPIRVKHLADEQVHVMHLREFSETALRTADKWSSLWENRLVIGQGDPAADKPTTKVA